METPSIVDIRVEIAGRWYKSWRVLMDDEAPVEGLLPDRIARLVSDACDGLCRAIEAEAAWTPDGWPT